MEEVLKKGTENKKLEQNQNLSLSRSGSVVTFPTELKNNNILINEPAYLRKLLFEGRKSLERDRKNRKIIRDGLIKSGYLDLSNSLVLQSSSSSSDEDDMTETSGESTINWESAEWGEDRSLHKQFWFSENLTIRRILLKCFRDFDTLVGWATHQTSNEPSSSRKTSLSEFKPFNPFLDSPNTPLPPSIITNISSIVVKQKAGDTIRETPTVKRHWKSLQFSTGKNDRFHKINRRKRKKIESSRRWNHGKQDHTYRFVKKNFYPIDSVQARIFEEKIKRNTFAAPESSSLDTSAQVALGMVIEEVITASLIPLAKNHVARCLSKNHVNSSIFDDWTMPPEDAIQAYLGHASSVSGHNIEKLSQWLRNRGRLPEYFKSALLGIMP